MEVQNGSEQDTDGGPAGQGAVCPAEAGVGCLHYIARNVAQSPDRSRSRHGGAYWASIYMRKDVP